MDGQGREKISSAMQKANEINVNSIAENLKNIMRIIPFWKS